MRAPCSHTPPCPAIDASNAGEAVLIWHDEKIGYSELCNGLPVWADEIRDDSYTHRVSLRKRHALAG